MKIQEKMRKPMLEAKISECREYRQISSHHSAFLFEVRKIKILDVSGGRL